MTFLSLSFILHIYWRIWRNESDSWTTHRNLKCDSKNHLCDVFFIAMNMMNKKKFLWVSIFFNFKLHDAGLMYKNNKDASNERESSINDHHRHHSHDTSYIVIVMIQNITERIIESSKTNVGKQFHCNFRIKLLLYK